MSDAELWRAWRLWMGLAVVIILVAAVLLIMIWRTARGIHAEALRALRAAEQIRESTNPIWALKTTNEVAGTMLASQAHLNKRINHLEALIKAVV